MYEVEGGDSPIISWFLFFFGRPGVLWVWKTIHGRNTVDVDDKKLAKSFPVGRNLVSSGAAWAQDAC